MRASVRPGRFHGIDGLRALAVVAVLVYHHDPELLPAGFLGVDLFFVISGFLITGILLADVHTIGAIDLAGFWRRRLRRLAPALLLLVAGVLAFAVVALPDETGRLGRESLGAVAWVANWQLLAGGDSYFEAAARPPLLRHLWSLGVEAQFYLLWPIALLVALRLGRAPVVLVLAVGGALASAGWMAALYDPDVDPSRVYFGTDTRLSGLLLGAALAVVVAVRPPALAATEPGQRRASTVAWSIVGLAGLLAVGAFFALASPWESFLYQGGFLGFAAVSTLLLAAVLASRPLARTLDLGPLRWLGERSYSIYLWHWPIYQLTRPEVDVPLDSLSAAVVRVGLTAVLAELSYRFVETPIRRGGWRVSDAWRVVRRPSLRAAPSALVSGATLALAAMLVAVTFAPTAGATDEAGGSDGTAGRPIEQSGDGQGASADEDRVPVPSIPTPRPTSRPAGSLVESPVGSPATGPSPTPAVPRIVAIGDSVLLSAEPVLAKRLPGIEVDAEIGRFFTSGKELVEERRAAGRLPDVVVIHLGNNAPLHTKQFDDLMSVLADVPRVVFVNLKLPRDWESHANEVLATGVARYPNAVLVDWHAAADGRKELFWRDGYHVRHEGAVLYTDLLAAAVRPPTGGR